MCRIGRADARADEDDDGDEGDVGEARDTDGEPGDPGACGKTSPDHEEPDQAADPERAGNEVKPVEQNREAARCGLGRVSRGAGDDQDGGG